MWSGFLSGLLAGETERLEVYADSAYGSGETRAALRAAGHDSVIKPIPLRGNIPGGFDRDDFVVDHHDRTVTCPAGHRVSITPSGKAIFGRRCDGCPMRSRCTSAARGRVVSVTHHDDELVYARQAWRDPVVLEHYRQHRPMVERTIAWLVARNNRKVRYRGVERNEIGLSARLGALNLRRLVNLGLHRDAGLWAMA